MKDFWHIPRIWEGAVCYILGGGPSLASVPFQSLYDKRVIAINDAYKLHQWDCMYFKDEGWFNRQSSQHDERTNEDRLHGFSGLKVTNSENLLGKPGIRVCKRGQRTGVEMGPTALTHGASAGQEAICLAARFGVAKIILLGYDMGVVGGRNNWHSDHNREIPPQVYEDQFLPRFESLNRAVMKMGTEVINCTVGSMLTEFPIGELGDHLD